MRLNSKPKVSATERRWSPASTPGGQKLRDGLNPGPVPAFARKKLKLNTKSPPACGPLPDCGEEVSNWNRFESLRRNRRALSTRRGEGGGQISTDPLGRTARGLTRRFFIAAERLNYFLGIKQFKRVGYRPRQANQGFMPARAVQPCAIAPLFFRLLDPARGAVKSLEVLGRGPVGWHRVFRREIPEIFF